MQLSVEDCGTADFGPIVEASKPFQLAETYILQQRRNKPHSLWQQYGTNRARLPTKAMRPERHRGDKHHLCAGDAPVTAAAKPPEQRRIK